MNNTYKAENDSARKRLFLLTSRLNDADLAVQMANGWSVAAALIHLAFWDRYYVALIGGWEQSGFSPGSINADAVNEAVHFLSRAIPPKAVVPLVQSAADAIDRKLEELTPELAAEIETSGHVRILRRAMHRKEHLDQIENALNAAHNGT